ncbi:hypothetical protein PC9H_007960 [Pleurotus ostreatus]|uniref:Ubiquitin-like domain-containing protein n=1 Tax=Pleurotus ostreatus TaxID=5322 RepID=A0A8H6ZSA4_PLEOS|nr:uncharacterized protein PC9H_007960 [Pleurotus ostreatus]KAF7428730.1 hypothetical protein PC9H_007960 [Pleurotus ostreatus]
MLGALGAGKVYAAITCKGSALSNECRLSHFFAVIEAHNLLEDQVKGTSFGWNRSSKPRHFYAILAINDRSDAEFELVVQDRKSDKKVVNIPMIFFADPCTKVEIKLYEGNNNEHDKKHSQVLAETQVPLGSLNGRVVLRRCQPGSSTDVILVFAFNAASTFQELPGTSDSAIKALKSRLELPPKLIKAFDHLCFFIKIGAAIAELNSYAKVALGVIAQVSSVINKYLEGKDRVISLLEDIGDVCSEVKDLDDEKHGELRSRQQAACQALFPVIYKCLHYVCTLGKLDVVEMSITRTVKERLDENRKLLKKASEKVKSARGLDTQDAVFRTLHTVGSVDEKLDHIIGRLALLPASIGVHSNCDSSWVSHNTLHTAAPPGVLIKANPNLELFDYSPSKELEPYQTIIVCLSHILQHLRSFSTHLPRGDSIADICTKADELVGLIKCVARAIRRIGFAFPMFNSHTVFLRIEAYALACTTLLKGFREALGKLKPHEHPSRTSRKSEKISLAWGLVTQPFKSSKHAHKAYNMPGNRTTCQWPALSERLRNHLCHCRTVMIQFLCMLISSDFIAVFGIHDRELENLTSTLTPSSWYDIKYDNVDSIWVREPGSLLYSIPLSFCETWNDFAMVIYQHCRNGPGIEYIRRGVWEIVHRDDGKAATDDASFANALRPGAHFNIGHIVQRLAATLRTCPHCGQCNPGGAPEDGWIRCQANGAIGSFVFIVFDRLKLEA